MSQTFVGGVQQVSLRLSQAPRMAALMEDASSVSESRDEIANEDLGNVEDVICGKAGFWVAMAATTRRRWAASRSSGRRAWYGFV